ncbi:hypothetical protein Jolie2_39 [Mycobacterium phage Jolie2]|uniref:Uncharacterized protein n=1 Tax=Mycobacterium phage Jolie2 TaxID=1458831 RepID=W8E9G2_9CAUD|nr:hypothetical protein Jolie2_39 [Mycobacterium phage Jolie2]AHJ86589.1 hypothetical protein Jolie2_39 [Mycobacterium phage Jolie2]
MADGRAWPGFQLRFCPVCRRADVATHREPVSDERGEVVAYHDHTEPKTGVRCLFAGERAAIKAVAFTASDTGIGPRETAATMLDRPRGSRAADELLARLNHQEKQRCSSPE